MNMVSLLEELGHTALEASSGQEALDILRADPGVNLVITDQGMPKMTGLELAMRIRADHPNFPIVIATGYAELPVGGAEFPKLAKPYSMIELEEAVARIMGQRTSGASGRL